MRIRWDRPTIGCSRGATGGEQADGAICRTRAGDLVPTAVRRCGDDQLQRGRSNKLHLSECDTAVGIGDRGSVRAGRQSGDVHTG